MLLDYLVLQYGLLALNEQKCSGLAERVLVPLAPILVPPPTPVSPPFTWIFRISLFVCVYRIYWIIIKAKAKNLGQYKIQRTVLTNPCLSLMLLVSLSLWNDTTFCIHCSPVDGLSGCMYIRFGISGSAFPATIHRLRNRMFGRFS